ncbi:MAG: alpha/beta hydrolase [Myxococcales bacterium]|nr:alpha/beta hydrolase [Myxococcales bacterium]
MTVASESSLVLPRVSPSALAPATRWRVDLLARTLRTAAAPFARGDAARARAGLDGLARLAPPPTGLRQASTRLGTRRARWTLPKRVEGSEVFLHVHGGGYALCSLHTHQGMLADLARRTGRRVLAFEYRKAPEYPFPRPIDDVVDAYRHLLATGVSPAQVVLSGDSAGGALALAATLRLRDRGEPLPRALALFSPWVDLRLRGDSIDAFARHDYLSRPLLERFRDLYLQGADPAHPEASPLLGDFGGFPPMLVQVGGVEVLRSEIEALATRARAHGAPAKLEVYDGMIHAWHGFGAILPEAGQAFRSVRRFVDDLR